MATAVVRMTERPTKIPMVSSFFPFLHSHCRWEGGWGWFGLVWFLGCPWVSLKWWVIGSCVVQFGRLPIRMNWSHQIVCLIVWEPPQGRRQPMRSRQEIERASTWVLRFWWILIVRDTTTTKKGGYPSVLKSAGIAPKSARIGSKFLSRRFFSRRFRPPLFECGDRVVRTCTSTFQKRGDRSQCFQTLFRRF